MAFVPFDSAESFNATELRGVGRVAARGAGASMSAQAAGLVVQLVSTIVLARLLTPADFGLVAMVTTFSLLFTNFGINGFTEAILQADQITAGVATNLFWMNLGAGALLTAGFAALGVPIAWFFHAAQVPPIAAGTSLAIIATSFSVVHLALLMRGFRFVAVYANDVVSRIASVLVSIVLATRGWGYWALVAGAVAQPTCMAAGAWILCRWTPGLPRRGRGTGPLLRFALNVYGRFTLNYFARNVDNVLVGKWFEAEALGFYKKAYDLFAISRVAQALTSVAVSALSRLRENRKEYERRLVDAIALSAFLGMACGGALTLAGKGIIRLLLGPRWDEAGTIFVFFGPGIGAMFLYGAHGWIHLSLGRADRWLRWSIAEFCATFALFVAGLRFGPAGIASAWSISLWLLTIPSLWYAGRPAQLSTVALLRPVWRYVVAAGLAVAVAALVAGGFDAQNTLWLGTLAHVLSQTLAFEVVYLLAVVALHRSIEPIEDAVRFVRIALLRRVETVAAVEGGAAI